MIKSWIIVTLFTLSVFALIVPALTQTPLAQIYTDLSRDSKVQEDCKQGCRVCLNAIASSTNDYYKQISQSTGLNTFIAAYNANPIASNNSNTLDGYTILSYGWDANPLIYGITNGFNLYGDPTTGPVFDGSAASVGDSYSSLNGQLYHIHVDQVDTTNNKASLWARTRDAQTPIYAIGAIRTPKCTFWGMSTTVHPPAPGPWGLQQALITYGCSNWANTLSSKQCNGKLAISMFTEGTLFALPNSIFNETAFDIGKWGYNNGTNSSEGWCNLFSYYSTQKAIPFQNGTTTGSASTQYFSGGAAQTIDYQYSLVYNNSDGTVGASQIYNGNANSIHGSIPIWLNGHNGSTLNVLDNVLDPKNKTAPKPVNPKDDNNNTSQPNFAHTVISGYSAMILCVLSMAVAMFAI